MMPAGPTRPVATWHDMLTAVLHPNLKVTAAWNPERTRLTLQVPTKKPDYLIPPLTLIIRPPAYRSFVLDPVAADLWTWCDGKNRVEQVIELFARKHNLTFHESRVSVTTYLKELVKRGVFAVAI
jgi:hypothetical protein